MSLPRFELWSDWFRRRRRQTKAHESGPRCLPAIDKFPSRSGVSRLRRALPRRHQATRIFLLGSASGDGRSWPRAESIGSLIHRRRRCGHPTAQCFLNCGQSLLLLALDGWLIPFQGAPFWFLRAPVQTMHQNVRHDPGGTGPRTGGRSIRQCGR